VRERDVAKAWLGLVERELGLLIAMTRKMAEEKHAEREAMDPVAGGMKEVG